MAKENKLVVSARDVFGTGNARRMRRAGWLPGAISNERGESKAIRLNRHDFDLMLRHHGGRLLLDMELDGAAPKKMLLKEVQRHPVTGDTLHADFVEVSMTRKVRVPIPVALVGEPEGVSLGGGTLEHLLRHVEVECLPGDIVEAIEIDVSQLKIGENVMVKDLRAPSTLTILTNGGLAVAAVIAPRKEEEALTPKAEEGAEPKIVGEEEEKAEEGAEEADAEE